MHAVQKEMESGDESGQCTQKERANEMTWQQGGRYRIVKHPARQQPFTLWRNDKVIQFTVSEDEAIAYATQDKVSEDEAIAYATQDKGHGV